MLGVRSARLTFVSPTSPICVTLFPMVHVGEAAFYCETYADAQAHDVVLLEGVRSPVGTRITRSYRWLVGSRDMAGLIVQPRFPTSKPRPRIVHADLSQEEFEAEWRKVPLWLRLTVYALSPVIGLRRRWRYSRERLAKDMSCEDQPSLAELLAMTPETGALTQAILHARDERLIERLCSEIETGGTEAKKVAVVYGATHMRAMVRELTHHRDFVVRAAEWRMVMAIA